MAIIPQETIQRILDETSIVELIEDYFPLKRRGVNFLALCPFHTEKTPSFNVNPQRQTFYCFGCQAGGDAIKFVQMYENLPFPDATKKLADRAGVMVEEEASDPAAEALKRGRHSILKLQAAAADWFHFLLFKKPIAQAARDYLRGRGIGMETARNWKLGFAPEDQRMLFDWAASQGFTIAQLVEGGLASWSDAGNPGRGAWTLFRHRLMFPVNNDHGEAIAFSGRVLKPDQQGGKYVNSPETLIFKKSRTFYGLDKTKRAIFQAKKAVVCEGQLDLIAAYEAGIQNVVAPLGTSFTEEQARVLKRHTEEAILCFDSDNAGLNAFSKTFRLLAPSGMLVRLAILPEGEDPDSLIRKRGVDAFREILDSAPEFFDFQIDRQDSALSRGTLRDRLNFAKALAADIALIEDKMLQDSLISRITVRIGVGEDEVRRSVNDASRALVRAEKSRKRREAIQKRRERSSSTGGEPQEVENPVSVRNRSVRTLCKCLLTDQATRDELTSQPVPEFFRDLPDTDLIRRLWQGQFEVANTSGVNAFVASLSDTEQGIVARILTEESPAGSLPIARDCLRNLQRQSIQNQIGRTKSQLGTPQLSGSEIERLGKLLLDLTKQLNDVAELG